MALDPHVRAELRDRFGSRVAFDAPLARYTSLRVGGPADALVRVDAVDELRDLLALCARARTPWLALGAGFNTLVRDGGVRGVVIRLAGLRALALGCGGGLRAEAGVTHASVARFCAEHGRSGLEFAVGIPGTVGGWLAMNAGIPDREMADVVERVELLVPGAPGVCVRERAELEFGYRQLALPAHSAIVAAEFRTEPDAPEAIRARTGALMERRRATQPVDQLSCGSVFVNPPGDHAGRLIEAAGLKGATCGGAQISELHANFIVNRGGARAADVLELIARARAQVATASGVELQTEVRIVGEDA